MDSKLSRTPMNYKTCKGLGRQIMDCSSWAQVDKSVAEEMTSHCTGRNKVFDSCFREHSRVGVLIASVEDDSEALLFFGL